MLSTLPEASDRLKTATVRTLSNIFDKDTRTVEEVVPGRKLVMYIPDELIVEGLVIVHNGEVATYDEAATTNLRHGDELLVYLVPTDAGTALTVLLIYSLIAVVSYGAYLAFSRPPVPPEPGLQRSRTYGFGGRSNVVEPGQTLPLIYGEFRIAPANIQQFQKASQLSFRSGEIHTLMAICHGPIESVRDIRADRNSVTTRGLLGNVFTDVRLGSVRQAPIEGFTDSVTTAQVEINLSAGSPVIYTTDDEIDRFSVVMRFFGGLSSTSNRGAIEQNEVQFRFSYRRSGQGGSFTDAGILTVTRASRNPFDVFFDSETIDRGRYEIQIQRITPDEGDATGQSAAQVYQVNEITDTEKQTYPHTALLAVRQIPAGQVQGRTPVYDCIVRGMLVNQYENEVLVRTAWSQNPAWCLLDYLTNKRHGLGLDIAKIDIDSFETWADFCDEFVSNADGTSRRRYKLNYVVDGSQPVIDVINNICTAGRANFLLRGDKWVVRPDRAEDPVQTFTMGRIRKDTFKISKIGKDEVATTVFADFWNEDEDWEQDSIPLEDETVTPDENQIERRTSLIGVTDPDQVNDLLSYQMLSNRLMRRDIEFEASAEAIDMEAGDVFRIAHDVPGWGFSGQFESANADGTVLILDREVTIESGKNYELTVVKDENTDVVIVTNTPGVYRRLTVSGDYTSGFIPVAKDHYSFGEVTKSTVEYKCRSITAAKSPLKRKISARQYDARVYAGDNSVLPGPTGSRLIDPLRIPDQVSNLVVVERDQYGQDGSLSLALDVHFELPLDAVAADVFVRKQGFSDWIFVETVSAGYASITENIESPGVTYEVSVSSVSGAGNRRDASAGVISTIETVGSLRQPDNVVNFRVERTPSGLIFRWDPVDPVSNFDLAYYEVRNGALWESALTLGRISGPDTTLETVAFATGTQTYQVKAFNTAGRESAIAAVVVIQVSGRISENVILTRSEAPGWTGDRVHFSINAGNLELDTADSSVAWRTQRRENSPVAGGFLRPGGFDTDVTSLVGTYTSAKFEVSVLNAARTFVSYDAAVEQIDTTLFWDATEVAGQSWDSDFARTRSWSVSPRGQVDVQVDMRFSTLTSAEDDFGPWIERPQALEVSVKWAQVRLRVTIIDPAFVAKVTALNVFFDVPEVIESGTATTSAAGAVSVSYQKTFNNAPDITAQIIGATAGDTVILSNQTTTGFDVEVRDSGGSRVVRTVNWHVIGF